MAGTFTSTGSYSNLTRLELEQLRKADFYAGLKALTVGDSALAPEGVVGPGSINAEPYLTGPSIILSDVYSITPPTSPGTRLGITTVVAQPATGLTNGAHEAASSSINSSVAGALYGPTSVAGSINGQIVSVSVAGNHTVTNGSKNVTSTIGTTAVGYVSPGQYINFSSQPGVYYLVTAITDTAITLFANYSGTGSSTASISVTALQDSSQTFVNALSGNVSVTNGSSIVLTTVNQVGHITTLDSVTFSEQPGVYYGVLAVNSTPEIILQTPYSGTTNTSGNATAFGLPQGSASNGMPQYGDVVFLYDKVTNGNTAPNCTAVGTLGTYTPGASNSIIPTNVNPGFTPTGLFSVTNGLTSVTTTLDQTGIIFGTTSLVVFASQLGVAYVVSGVTSSTLTLVGAYEGTTNAATAATGAGLATNANTAAYGIVRSNAVQLFAVPGSGPTGSEQTFMAVLPTSTLHNNLAPSTNLINADRIKNVIPAQYTQSTTIDRSDAIYDSPGPRLSLDKLGYRVVLYPDNGSGTGPNLAAPITTLSPIIDPGIPSTDQRFTVDYKSGIIRFSCAPKVGGQIKVSGGVNATTGRLNLYAVYWAYPAPGSSSSLITSSDGGSSASAVSNLYSYSPEVGYSFQSLTQIQTAYRKMSRLYADSTAAANWDAVLTAGSGTFSGTGNFFNWVFNSFYGIWVGSFTTITPTWAAVSTNDNGRTVSAIGTIGSHTMENLYAFGAEPTGGFMAAASAGSGGFGITTSDGDVFYQIDRFSNSSFANSPTLNVPSQLVWFPFNSNLLSPSWVAVTGGTHSSTFNAALMINSHNTGLPSSGSTIGGITFHVTNGSVSVTASSSVAGLLATGNTVSFASDARYYTIATVVGTAITLVAQYQGSNAASATGTVGFWQDFTSKLPSYWQSDASAGNFNVSQLITCQSTATADSKGPRLLMGRCVTNPSTGSSYLLMMDGGGNVTDVSPSVLTNKTLTGMAYSTQDNLWGIVAHDASNNLYFYITSDISVITSWTQVTMYPSMNLTGGLATVGGVWLLQYSDTLGTNRVLYSGDVSKFQFMPGKATVTSNILSNPTIVQTTYDLSYALIPGTIIQFLSQVGVNYVVQSATSTTVTLTTAYTGSSGSTSIYQPVLLSTPNGNPGSATSNIVSNGSAAVVWSTGNVEFSKQSGFPGGY